MFETMGQFYAFFFPTLALIILGIVFEEKLVAFERWILRKIGGIFHGAKRAFASKSR